jgi:hypothetical protein
MNCCFITLFIRSINCIAEKSWIVAKCKCAKMKSRTLAEDLSLKMLNSNNINKKDATYCSTNTIQRVLNHVLLFTIV